MLHFGKDIKTRIGGGNVIIGKKDHSGPDGHLLFAISFNYKLSGILNKGR
jgi:hypothetical protein